MGKTDLLFDTITRDLIDASDGWFAEVTDCRMMVWWQLECAFNAWWGDALSGSRMHELLERDEPTTPEELVDETKRALQQLVAEGFIAELRVGSDVNERNEPILVLAYTDRSSGSPIDDVYDPTAGSLSAL